MPLFVINFIHKEIFGALKFLLEFRKKLDYKGLLYAILFYISATDYFYDMKY